MGCGDEGLTVQWRRWENGAITVQDIKQCASVRDSRTRGWGSRPTEGCGGLLCRGSMVERKMPCPCRGCKRGSDGERKSGWGQQLWRQEDMSTQQQLHWKGDSNVLFGASHSFQRLLQSTYCLPDSKMTLLNLYWIYRKSKTRPPVKGKLIMEVFRTCLKCQFPCTCGSCNDNGSHRRIYLNTWSPIGTA